MAERLPSFEHPFIRRPQQLARDGRRDLRVVINAASDEAEIYLYDEIGFFGITANDFRQQLDGVRASRIALHINSPGGDVFDAVAIYNMLRSHPAEVVSYVDSVALSAASFIAVAGDRVVMAQHSQLMIHDAWGVAIGNAEDMKRAADFLERQSDLIAGIYAERRGETVEHWRGLMAAETWFTADEAVASGLADEVGSEDAVENRFDLSIFRNAPRPAAPQPRAEDTDHEDTSALAQEHLRFERTRARLQGVA